MLPLLRLHKRYVGNRVRKRAHIFRARNVLRSVRRKLGGKCGIFAKRFCEAAAQRLCLGFVIRRCNERHGVHSQVFPVFKAGKTRAANSVHKHAHCIAREIQHLTDAAQRADAVNVVLSDLVFPYILLRCKEHNALLLRCSRKRFHTPLPACIKMQQFAGEHHKAPQRNKRDMFINRIVSFHGLHSFFPPDGSGVGFIQLYI